CSGLVERIGHEDADLKYKAHSFDYKKTEQIDTHKAALEKIAAFMLHPEYGVIHNTDEIEVVGHRVVHGGNSFSNTTLINSKVKKDIQKCAALAPLHNPNSLIGIQVSEQLFPS